MARQTQKKKRLGYCSRFFSIAVRLVSAHAAKQIAHTTHARLAVDRAQKGWDVRRISNEVTRVVEKFSRHVPMQFLGPKCTELKANKPIEADGGFPALLYLAAISRFNRAVVSFYTDPTYFLCHTLTPK